MYEKCPGFYTLLHRPTGFFYIGSTSNVQVRISKHRFRFKEGTHANPKLREVFTVWEDLNIQVTYTNSLAEAVKSENQLIEAFRHLETLCNVKGTRDGIPKITGTDRFSADARSKMSKSSQRAVSIDGVVFASRKAAAESLGVTPGAISWGIKVGTGKFTDWKDLSTI